uniref:Uncharacterized protein n=1 Tax=Romanomermis culicivorax TaxID=13658 RepID=A0A915JB05_ROMCU
MPPNATTVLSPNLAAPPVLGQILDTAAATSASTPAVYQILPPINIEQIEIDPNIDRTNSTKSFLNLDPLLAPAATLAPTSDHHSSLAIANANEVHNFGLEARDTLERFNTAAVRITNNVPTIQTTDQIIGAVSD